jgi:hypothetical protein
LILASLILFLLQQLVAFPHLSLFVPQGFCDREVFNAPILNCPFIAYIHYYWLDPSFLFIIWFCGTFTWHLWQFGVLFR